MKYIECINPRINKYRVRWDVQPYTDPETSEPRGTVYWEEEFTHTPTLSEIKEVVTGWYNTQIDEKIVSGYTWKDTPVWLSTENQFNYKAAYDMAVQTEGASLPVTFKFGTNEEPVYYEFTTLDDLAIFYTGAMTWVNTCLAEGWQTKDSIDWSVYEVTDNENGEQV